MHIKGMANRRCKNVAEYVAQVGEWWCLEQGQQTQEKQFAREDGKLCETHWSQGLESMQLSEAAKRMFSKERQET